VECFDGGVVVGVLLELDVVVLEEEVGVGGVVYCFVVCGVGECFEVVFVWGVGCEEDEY